jgi:hypothetical protein
MITPLEIPQLPVAGDPHRKCRANFQMFKKLDDVESVLRAKD